MALLLLISLLIKACSPQAEAINYGLDACHFCKMTIVDKQHAAEAVTDKGKVYKFDAIECMVDYVNDRPQQSFAFLLVNDYLAPESWLDANTASFLISPAIPSPMGAFLSAFETQNIALEMKNAKGGDIYNWEKLLSIRER